VRVLQVHTRYRQPGGEDGVVAQDAVLLRDAGHDVRLHDTENASGPRAALQLAAAPWNAAAARALRRDVAAFRPDVVHVHNTWFATGPAAVRAAVAIGVPVVMTLHNWRLVCAAGTLYRDGGVCEDCVGTHPWRGVVHRCYRDSVPSSAAAASTLSVHRRVGTWDGVHRFLALTSFARDLLVRGGLPSDRTVVRPNSVPDVGARPAPPSASRTLVFAGRLSEEKGIEPLLQAWRRRRPDGLALVVAGDGPLRERLEAEHGDRVDFVGQLAADELRSVMLRARALLLPSRWYEGQPLVQLEALSSGLPGVVSDLGALPETSGPDAAWVVPPDDLEAWSDAFEAVLDDADVDRRGSAARARYEAAYSAQRGLHSLLDVYDSVRAATATSS
jgi:glycosyltransferase involved in cell wall biosynthesis